MTSNHHAPYDLGYNTCYNGQYKGQQNPRGQANPIKLFSSSDCSLQLDYMKLESLVIVDQHATVNTFPVLYTPPVTPRGVCNTRSRWSNLLGASRRRVGQMIGVKS